MEPPLPTPAQHILNSTQKDTTFSSSPAFATPVHPIRSRTTRPIEQPIFVPTRPAQQAQQAQTVLPISLPPQTLRPVAFRTLTKKHNLTITSSGLGALATFIGRYCGEGWRSEGLAEKVLDEIAKLWKHENGGLILDDAADKKLKNILKNLEPCMSGGRLEIGRLSRANTLQRSESLMSNRPGLNHEDSQGSLGLSNLDVEDDHATDARAYLKVVSAFKQPRLAYSNVKRTLEVLTDEPSLMPPIQHKIAMFRNRFHLVHQRLLRNESFQTTTFAKTTAVPTLSRSTSSAATMSNAYKITPISNLLGRSGTSHLLLGLLVHNAAGDLALMDLTGSAILDLTTARPVPDYDAWFCPGMMVLVEGLYEDDGSASLLGSAGGVGGQIKGKLIVDTMAGPPAERREVSLGTGHNHKIDAVHTVAGAGFGWFDFLGTGSEKAIGQQMRRLQRKTMIESRRNILLLGECHLDNPRTLDAIKAILVAHKDQDQPLSIVLLGNFLSTACMAGSAADADSIHYKEAFDSLASLLSDFPDVLSSTTFIFVPGDNDPWSSAFSAGASSIVPRQGVPDLFTSRIRRVVNNANSDANHKKDIDVPGEVIFTSNPARVSLFGPVDEIVLFRDDITGRIRRNAVLFTKTQEEMDNDISAIIPDNEEMPDYDIELATSRQPETGQDGTHLDKATLIGRRLTKLLLDQSHLVPFAPSTRSTLWDFSHSLNLYPLPTALCVCDAEAPPFCITYEGCHVMNPGNVIGKDGWTKRRGGGLARYIEYDILKRRGEIREIRF